MAGEIKTWQQALDYVATLNSGNGTNGYKDWYLPNLNELESLIELGKYNPSLQKGHPFINVKSSGYWSSTTSAHNTLYARIVNMSQGVVGTGIKLSAYYVWAVRSGLCGSSNNTVICIPQTGQTTSYYAGDDGDLQQGIFWYVPTFFMTTGTGQ